MLKEKIKEGMINHIDAVYAASVRNSRVDYDSWIRDKEKDLESFDMTVAKKEDVDDGDTNLSFVTSFNGTTVRIFPYKSVDASFSIKNIIEDIIVFTNGILTDKAIPLIVDCFKNPVVDVVYGNEDRLDSVYEDELSYGDIKKEKRIDPYFKPDWAPNAFLDHFYFGNMVAVRRSAFREEMVVRENTGAACLYENMLRFLFRNERNLRKSVEHIDEVLIHVTDYSLCELKLENTDKFVSKELVDDINAKISVVIPSKDNPHLLKKCLGSLKDTTGNTLDYEVIVVDNGSSDENRSAIETLKDELGFTYIYRKSEFNFAAMINEGAKAAKGKYLLLLNDDITFVKKDSLSRMLSELKYRFTGAVGCKLVYPDSDMIQHAGVFNDRIGPVHRLQFMDDKLDYYHGFNRHVQNVSAVTGACILVRKDLFDKSGGMNETLKVAFNDIDFCFRIMEMGYVNVVCNDIFLEHAESVTRGKDTDSASLERLNKERGNLYRLHKKLLSYDPFGSKYLKKDCLDVRFAPASEYEYTRAVSNATGIKVISEIPGREEPCIQLSVEYAGKFEEFSFDESDTGNMYLQGFSYVMGSDNACYKKSILLQSDTLIYKLGFEGVIREDVALACSGEINVEKSGFSVNLSKAAIPDGKYRVGILYEKKASKEKLYRFSNKIMVVK